MKRVKEKSEVRRADFAQTIYRVRKERKMTQKQVAEIVGVTNRTISKWEKGETVPDLETVKRLCKDLSISPSAIIKSERKFKDYKYAITYNIKKVFKFLLRNIFLIGFIVVFILLLIYFINNYNTIEIYNITYSDDNVTFENGYFFKTKAINMLTINNIKLNKIKYEPSSVKVELYTYLNGDKYIFYEGDSLNNILIEENKSYIDLLTNDVIKNIKNNLYIKIETIDEDNNSYSYENKLVLKERANNNKLSYVDYFEEPDNEIKDLDKENPFLMSKTNNRSNKLESLGYSYDKETDTYTKVDSDGGVIEYSPKANMLKKEMIKNDLRYLLRYINGQKLISYKVSNVVNDEIIMDVKYYVDAKVTKCIKGKCKNFNGEIDYILSIYEQITKVS